MSLDDSLLDDLFHGCAVLAFVEQAMHQGGWPDSEATRQRAYRMYEDELAARSKSKNKAPECDPADP